MKSFFGQLEQVYCSERVKSKYLGADYDWMVLCPPARLKQFGELLDDAIKATPENSVYRQRVQLIKDAVYKTVMSDSSRRIREILNNIKLRNCIKTSTVPLIDGKVADKCWEKVGYAKDWTSIDGSLAAVKTEV